MYLKGDGGGGCLFVELSMQDDEKGEGEAGRQAGRKAIEFNSIQFNWIEFGSNWIGLIIGLIELQGERLLFRDTRLLVTICSIPTGVLASYSLRVFESKSNFSSKTFQSVRMANPTSPL
jgi:hypothetical protein